MLAEGLVAALAAGATIAGQEVVKLTTKTCYEKLRSVLSGLLTPSQVSQLEHDPKLPATRAVVESYLSQIGHGERKALVAAIEEFARALSTDTAASKLLVAQDPDLVVVLKNAIVEGAIQTEDSAGGRIRVTVTDTFAKGPVITRREKKT